MFWCSVFPVLFPVEKSGPPPEKGSEPQVKAYIGPYKANLAAGNLRAVLGTVVGATV